MYDITNLSLTWDFSTFWAFYTFVLFQQWKVLACTKDKSTALSHLLYFLFKKVCTIIFGEYVVLNLKISKAESKNSFHLFDTLFFFPTVVILARSSWVNAFPMELVKVLFHSGQKGWKKPLMYMLLHWKGCTTLKLTQLSWIYNCTCIYRIFLVSRAAV